MFSLDLLPVSCNQKEGFPYTTIVVYTEL